MTSSPRSKQVEFHDLDGVLAAIRAAGGRVSAARRFVLEALFEADEPRSAEQITHRVADRGLVIEIASVYRNLESLEGLGVVRHVHLGHGPGLYGLVGGGEREYLACERCNRVRSVEPESLDPVRSEIRARFGYEARFSHFPITGLCAECARRETDGQLGAGDGVAGPAHEHSDGSGVHAHASEYRQPGEGA